MMQFNYSNYLEVLRKELLRTFPVANRKPMARYYEVHSVLVPSRPSTGVCAYAKQF
jgi:hypothetical protein